MSLGMAKLITCTQAIEPFTVKVTIPLEHTPIVIHLFQPRFLVQFVLVTMEWVTHFSILSSLGRKTSKTSPQKHFLYVFDRFCHQISISFCRGHGLTVLLCVGLFEPLEWDLFLGHSFISPPAIHHRRATVNIQRSFLEMFCSGFSGKISVLLPNHKPRS